MRKRSKISFVLLTLIAAVVIARVLAPGWITNYVNKSLNDIPGYAGSIDDIDLFLWRGAYTIHGIDLRKLETDSDIPFIAARQVVLSVQWESLLNGAVVGEIEFIGADLNFISGRAEESGQFRDAVNWTKPIQELLPIDINRMAISDGRVRFLDAFSTPPVDIAIESVQLELLNLRNVVDSGGSLPSPLKVSATSAGGGSLTVDGKINALKQVPDFDINARLEGVFLPALNDVLRAYASIDVEKGVFNLYVELAAHNGQIDGYVKPVITDLQILSLENDSDRALLLLWEGLVGLVSEVFENQSRDQFASKVPISGSLESAEFGVLRTLFDLLSNAFVLALKKPSDGDIDFTGLEKSIGDDQAQVTAESKPEQALTEQQAAENKAGALVDKALDGK